MTLEQTETTVTASEATYPDRKVIFVYRTTSQAPGVWTASVQGSPHVILGALHPGTGGVMARIRVDLAALERARFPNDDEMTRANTVERRIDQILNQIAVTLEDMDRDTEEDFLLELVGECPDQVRGTMNGWQGTPS